jgi:YHS domain-containing protein
MKPAFLSLLLFLPLVSCSTTTPAKPADAQVDKTEARSKKGRHSRHAKKEAAAATTASTAAVKPYPLKTCLVTGDKLDPKDEQITTVYKGQEYQLCCRKCLAKFKKDPAKYAALLNKA